MDTDPTITELLAQQEQRIAALEATVAEQDATIRERNATLENLKNASRDALSGTMGMISYLLYNYLTFEQRSTVISEHKNLYTSKVCKACHLYQSRSSDLYSCIHNTSCSGLCRSCHYTMGDTCPACHQEQVVTCPVCYEEKKQHEVITGRSCSHSICLACYEASHSSGHPIERCPMCRTQM